MGRLKSAVLYYKNGTLSEERFKNLTPLQWLFHYYEINLYRNKELEFVNNIVDIVLDRIETLWYVVNPSVGKELIERLKEGTIKTDKDIDGISPETFAEQWAEILNNIPAALEIPVEVDRRNKKAYQFPTFSKDQLRKKALGIKIEY